MARKSAKAPDDMAIEMGTKGNTASRIQEHEKSQPRHAPLDDTVVVVPAPAEKPELYDKTTRELLIETEFDDPKGYFVGVRSDAPFDSRTICGKSFERRKGEWDSEMKSWSWQKGRHVELSPRLAEVIRHRMTEIYVECEMSHDDLGRPFARRIRRTFDEKKNPEKIKRIRRQGPVLDRFGRKKEQWFPLSRFLILEERAASTFTSVDQFQAEKQSWERDNKALAEANRVLQAKLAKLENQGDS